MRASLFGSLPPGEVDEVFAALDAASRYAGEVQIIGVDSGVPSLAKHLKGAGLTDPDAFDKLNRLAENRRHGRTAAGYLLWGFGRGERRQPG